MEILELYCDLLLAWLSLIQATKEEVLGGTGFWSDLICIYTNLGSSSPPVRGA
ncbi:IST1 homolog isoform X1 [Prionailurus iriomotensis]